VTAPVGADAPAEDYREEWIAKRLSGFSYRQIGEEYGFSHEMVRLIIGDDARVSSERPATARRNALAEKIREYLEAEGPVPRDELIARFGINNRQLIYIASHDPSFPKHLIILARRDTSEQYSDEDLHAAMQRAWAAVREARPGVEGLSHVLYDAYRDVATDPSPARIIGRYFTWNRACEAAGIPDGGMRRGRTSYSTAWTDAEILAAVRRFVADMTAAGKRSTYGRFDVWQRDHDDAPSGTTVRNRMKRAGLVTWPDIIEAAMAGGGGGE
jgi:hypothetical protein